MGDGQGDGVAGVDPDDQQLIRELYPALRRIAAVAGPVDVEPDDLVQEALVRTLRRHRLGDLDHPLAYLRTVIVNLASNQRRSAARRRRAFERHGAESSTQDAYPSDMSELMALSPRARALLYLVEVERLPYDHAATQLGMTVTGARKAASRARKRLRTVMEAGHA
jgi:RNA polymerase sigma factor (sigma-70 family)